MPKIKNSVCIATYNGENFIKEQLDSILIQLDEDDEIVISDDGSSDSTIQIIKSINDKRIKIVDSEKFSNPTFNFENALKYSSGDYIFLSDQDDVWVKDKIEKISNLLNQFDLVLHDCLIMDAHFNLLLDSMLKLNNAKPGVLRNIFKNSYMGCCMAFRRSVLEKSLPFPKGIPMHDQWIGLIAEVYGKVTFSNMKLVKYRRHFSNASSTGSKSTSTIFQKLKNRVLIIFHLIKRVCLG